MYVLIIEEKKKEWMERMKNGWKMCRCRIKTTLLSSLHATVSHL